ncbi:MAG: head-tail connector protein [Clostridium sp.]
MAIINDLPLEELKSWLKIDYDDDDMSLVALKLTAEEFLSNSGVIKDYSKNQYKTCIKFIVKYWFDNRGLVGKVDETALGITSMIVQLR